MEQGVDMSGYGSLLLPNDAVEQVSQADDAVYGRFQRIDVGVGVGQGASFEQQQSRSSDIPVALSREVMEVAVIQVQSSIRDNVRNLPGSRHKEIFDDFAGAVKTEDIGYLADTIVNWAFGGHGYDYAGVVVNRVADAPRAPSRGEPGYKMWKKFKARSRKGNDEF
jgi:hypothetical protein